jgi:hypothetical protein
MEEGAHFFLENFTQPRGEANSLFLSRNIYTASRQIAYFFLVFFFYSGAGSFFRKFWKMRVGGQASFSHFPALRRQMHGGRQIFPYFREIFFKTDRGRLLRKLPENLV